MKKLVGVTALLGGLLLAALPRFILPTCEFQGFPAMHCSDTARAEIVTGIILAAVGVLTLSMKSMRAALAGSLCALFLLIVSFALPSIFGYCQSSRMPCNYGTVPGVRFIDSLGGFIIMIGLIGIIREYRKKGKA